MSAKADIIFYGGEVITVDDANPTAEAIAVKDGRILAVGTRKKVERTKGRSTKMIDMTGRTILPGFVEPHSHPLSASFVHNHFVSVSGFQYSSKMDAIEELKNVVKETPEGEWVLAYGFDPVIMTDLQNAPSRESIDKLLSNTHPVLILSQTGHGAFANTKAFEAANVSKDSLQPKGGVFALDEAGELLGTIFELPAIQHILKATPHLSDDKRNQYVRKELNVYAKAGVTTVAELGVAIINPSEAGVRAFESIGRQPGCPVRLVGYVPGTVMNICGDKFPPSTPTAETNTHIVGVKFFADGSPFIGTMAVLKPFLNTPLTQRILAQPPYPCYGYINHSFADMIALFRPSHQRGHQIAVHCHGDRACQQVLDVFQALLAEHPRDDHRHRLEHCGLITPDQLQRASHLGVTVSLFVDQIYFYGQGLKNEIVGPERAARWTPLKSAARAGHRFSVHSDTPCVPLGPMRTLRTAVTRLTRATDEFPEEVLGPDERLTVDEAIKAMTIYPAWQLFHEHLIGSIEVGKLADLVVLDRNPRNVEPRELDTIQVVETYRSGKKVEEWK